MRLFFGYNYRSPFVARDERILESAHQVVSRDLHHANPMRALGDFFLAASCRTLVLWFVSLRDLPVFLAAILFRRRLVLIVGGYEAANLPELGYGSARRRLPRAVVRLMLLAADQVVAVSQSSRDSIVKNLDIPAERIEVVYHGFDDLGELPQTGEPGVVTIGNLDSTTWLIKGIKEFYEAAAAMPDIPFTHIGAIKADAAELLGKPTPPIVRQLGSVPHTELGQHLHPGMVYLQMSRHESFGCAVADAMLHGCIPVVADVFALPELVGDCGVLVKNRDADGVIAGIRQALEMGHEEAVKCRRRILNEFPLARRRERLLDLVGES